jgi:uncharacterized protein YecE (DUF72 family)
MDGNSRIALTDMHIYIGTSGYQYAHWNNGVFYPRGVKDRLSYALQKMTAVEINSTFYRIPPPENVASWAAKLLGTRKMVLKAPQSVSHRRRLKLHSDASIRQGIDLLNYFSEGALRIPAENRGPVLLQLPGQMEMDLSRLEPVLQLFAAHELQVALEVRHASWFDPTSLRLLEKYNAALVASDWQECRTPLIVTADFVYVRRHGPREQYASEYDDEALLADLALLQRQTVPNAYVFFNNDVHAYAPHNAMRMIELLALQRNAA